MTRRPEVDALLVALLARSEPKLTLDLVAQTIGAAVIDVGEIDALILELEARGRLADEAWWSASASLSLTLSSARKLRQRLGRAPNAEEIASEAGVPVSVVRAGLFFARILQR